MKKIIKTNYKQNSNFLERREIYMGKLFSVIGYLILVFIILSNYLNIQLSDTR